jgi:hypothetical protein
MSEATAVPSPGSSPADFASWIGIDPALLNDDTPEETPEVAPEVDAETEVDVEVESDELNDEAEPNTQDAEEKNSTDEKAESVAEAPKLPFEAVAGDEAVDPALLATMQIKLKADGKDGSLSLADVVRRAQSEPAAQRKARMLESRVNEVERHARDFENELAEVRRVALQMARDPDYYAQVVSEVEGYDQPEARAARAEEALAARTKQEQEAKERAARESQLMEFATTAVAPALNAIVTNNPLVSQEEILGRFYADTAKITVNGVIPPEYHASVAEYLRTDLAEFVAQRQQTYADRDAKVKAETLKTQRERQKMKNTAAMSTKPTGQSGALRDTPTQPTGPRTHKDASADALAVLLNGMT